MEFNHVSVLKDEVIKLLDIKPDGMYLDGTIGGAGHSIEIAKRLSTGKLVGIDRDQDALDVAEDRLSEYSENTLLLKGNFKDMRNLLMPHGLFGFDGILLDIGVSSYQIDNKERGFSFINDSELDMRMDKSQELTAKYVVNNYSKEELENIFWNYGEEKWGKRIAEFIIEERSQKEIETTLELVDIIKKAIPKKIRMEGKHPAKRVFQALRIEVNKELDVLESTLGLAVERLKEDGRLAIITFHSIEDRIVKTRFMELAKGCTCPPEFPICVCDKKQEIKIITRRPITASAEELEENRRAKSAKLRICKKI